MFYVLWMLTSHNATSLEASAEPVFASSVGSSPKPEGLLCANNVTDSRIKKILKLTSVNFAYCDVMYVFDFIYSLGHFICVCFTLKHSFTQ